MGSPSIRGWPTIVVPIAAHHDCPLCGSATFWRHRRPGSPWICGVCVPPRHEPHEVEWAEEVTP